MGKIEIRWDTERQEWVEVARSFRHLEGNIY